MRYCKTFDDDNDEGPFTSTQAGARECVSSSKTQSAVILEDHSISALPAGVDPLVLH